jgi:hypothetical protein
MKVALLGNMDQKLFERSHAHSQETPSVPRANTS